MKKKITWEKLEKINHPYFKYLKRHMKKIEKDCHYILGDNVTKLEIEMSKYLNVKYCVAVGSGLDALTISLMSLNLPKNGEVIVPSNTFYASIVAILRVGLKPVLCEPDKDTFNITSNNIEKLINSKTVAIMPVHLYGNPCDMESIKSIAEKHKLKIIEDCAQAFGAEFHNQKVGTFGDLGAFSFYTTKNLGGISDGGMIVTNNYKLYCYCEKTRNYGGLNYKYDIIGLNSRMDEILALFLRRKLVDIDKLNSKKISNAKLYLKYVSNPLIELPIVSDNVKSVFHIFCIKTKDRDKLKKYLETKNIYTLIHYPIPLSKQEALKDVIKDNYPIANELSNNILSLPCSVGHTKREIKYVIKALNEYKG